MAPRTAAEIPLWEAERGKGVAEPEEVGITELEEVGVSERDAEEPKKDEENEVGMEDEVSVDVGSPVDETVGADVTAADVGADVDCAGAVGVGVVLGGGVRPPKVQTPSVPKGICTVDGQQTAA